MVQKTTVGLKQVTKDAPAWAMNLTAMLAILALVGPDLIDDLPGSLSPVVKEWIEFGLKAVTVIAAAIGVVSGQKEKATYESLKRK